MSCNKTLLGFDIDSQQVACVNFRVNPENYYLNCSISANTNLNIQCSAYTNSGCTTLLEQDGYFAYEDGFREYSKSFGEWVLAPLDFCLISNYVRKCCGSDEIYQITNLTSYLGFAAPVGIVLDIEVTDSNFNVFRQCFEVISSVVVPTPQLTLNNLFGKYGFQDCESCLENNSNCYVKDGDYVFKNCKTDDEIVLTIPESNIYKLNDVVLFSGECYYLTAIEPFLPTSGVTGNILPGGCDNSLCEPIPPVTIKSSYVSGCCDNKIYKLLSPNQYSVGLTLSVNPSNFCYTVIPTPSPQVTYNNLNDLGGVIITTGCNDIKCQKCPTGPAPQPIPTGPTATGCEPITFFNMGIQCLTVNPTSTTLGILSVFVSGGTQPYSYTWTTPEGQKVRQKTLIGQPEGTYEIEVIDKYGDFVVKEFCTLTEIKDCTFQGIIKSIPVLDCIKTTAIQGYCFD